jgi:glycosyltransferase involved in cell wall biosynthesis
MYNEEHSIAQTLDGLIPICERDNLDILVVDDGSFDDSYLITTLYISNQNFNQILLMQLPFNCGVGAAMRSGFTWAYSQGYTSVIQFDSDGQHDPEWISKLIEESNEFDVVIGSRFELSQKFTSNLRRITMRILSRIIFLKTGLKISDPTSGFRLTKLKAMEIFSSHYPTEYLGDTLNSIVVANAFDLKVGEIPVRMHSRKAGEPSTGILKSSLYLSRSIFSIMLYQGRRRNNE